MGGGGWEVEDGSAFCGRDRTKPGRSVGLNADWQGLLPSRKLAAWPHLTLGGIAYSESHPRSHELKGVGEGDRCEAC